MLTGLFLLSLPAMAAPALSQQQKKIYQQVIQLKVHQVRALAQQQLQQAPNSAVNLLLANYPDFFELCVQQDQRLYAALLGKQEARLEKLENMPQNSAWTSYATAEVGMQIAMCKLLFGNRLSAAWGFRNAYQQYRQNVQKYPDFIPNRKNLGVLQVLIGSVPDQYKWFLNIIGLKGSVQQGMQNLKLAATSENPFQQEAQLLYVVLLHMTEQEQEPHALEKVTRLAKAQKDNLLTSFVAMHLLKKSKQGEAALQVYMNRPTGPGYLSFPYLHHMAADLYLYKGLYEKSVQENRLFLAQHQGRHYLKSAHFKLYLAYALDNHLPQAAWYLQQIQQVGIAEAEEDKYADRFAVNREPLVKPLMQARLHSDGGYYDQALQELQESKLNGTSPPVIQAEYYYRKARIYHGQELLQQAITNYEKTISLCKGTDLYFAPNAALQLGYIYQQLKQPQQAKAHFQQALSFKNHAYKNSIDAKAKLALSAM